jgi:hypothetical protein
VAAGAVAKKILKQLGTEVILFVPLPTTDTQFMYLSKIFCFEIVIVLLYYQITIALPTCLELKAFVVVVSDSSSIDQH